MGVGARIAGVAMALPERLVSNEQIAADARGRCRLDRQANRHPGAALGHGGRAPVGARRGRRPGRARPRRDRRPRARPGAGRDLDRRRDHAQRGAAGRGADRRRSGRRVRRRRRLHRLAVGAGDGVRADRIRTRRARAGGRRGLPVALPRRLRSRHRAAVRRRRRRRGRLGDRGADRADRTDRAALRSLRIASDPVGPGRPHPDGRAGVVPGGGGLDGRRDHRGARRLRLRPRGHRPVRLPPGQLADHPRRSASGWGCRPSAWSTTSTGSRTPRPRRCRSRCRWRRRKGGSSATTWCCWPRSAEASPGERPSCSGARERPARTPLSPA